MAGAEPQTGRDDGNGLHRAFADSKACVASASQSRRSCDNKTVIDTSVPAVRSQPAKQLPRHETLRQVVVCMIVRAQEISLRLDRLETTRLAGALALSIALHLLGWGTYSIGKRFHVWDRLHWPAWVQTVTQKAGSGCQKGGEAPAG